MKSAVLDRLTIKPLNISPNRVHCFCLLEGFDNALRLITFYSENIKIFTHHTNGRKNKNKLERTKTNNNNNLKKLHEKSTSVNSKTVLT